MKTVMPSQLVIPVFSGDSSWLPEAENKLRLTHGTENILVYWRQRKDLINSCCNKTVRWTWHTNVRWLGDCLQPGDQLWVITSGAQVRHEDREAGFLVALWTVGEVIENANDDPAFLSDDFRFRIVADDVDSVTFDDPVLVDEIVRPEGRLRSEPIGRFLSRPKRLDERAVRRLRAAAGPELALKWLKGNRR